MMKKIKNFIFKKKTNDTRIENEKVFKLRTKNYQVVGRIILWALILFLLFRGIGSVVKGNGEQSIEKKVNDSLKSNEEKVKFSMESSAFAEAFAKEYLTYKQGSDEDYQKRISKYTPRYLSIMDSISGTEVQALSAMAIKSEYYTDTQINVDVRVKVKYSGDVEKELFLRVPITKSNDKYFVEDLPVFISDPGSNRNGELKVFTGKLLEESETTKIKETLQNFLRVYCEGSESEINYYMYDANSKINGLNGEVKYKSIDDIRAFRGKDLNNSIVIVSYYVEDPNSNQNIKQNIHLKVIKKDGRYYIQEFNTRTGNLIESGRYK